MPFDAESKNVAQPRVGPEQSASRASRPLGRGLEDISHLFLSQTTGPREPDPMGSRALEEARPGWRNGATVLRPSEQISKEQLTATLRECRGALDDGVHAIHSRISCWPYGEIDLLALNRVNELTVIEVDSNCGDGLLLRGVNHVEWVMRNLASVQRMFPEWAIDRSRPPSLFLVAPRFSPFLRGALRRIAHSDITCFRYFAVHISGGTGILFERLNGEGE